MAANLLYLPFDNSTYANYSGWASAISAQMASFGWVQSTDTGQVMWSGMTLSAVSMSGSNATYTYASLTGLPLAVGRALTITGMTNAGNNKTLVITSFTGTTSGTFTVVNASGVTESGSTGVVTAQTTAPGSAAYFYEIWKPGDGLTSFFFKLETGNISGTNNPVIRVTLSTTTNGAGTASGFIAGPTQTASSTFSPNAAALYPCYFSGASGRACFCVGTNGPNMVVVGRSVNSSGADTGTYASYWVCGQSGSNNPNIGTQVLYFGVGATTFQGHTLNVGHAWGGQSFTNLASTVFNGSLAIALSCPLVGFFDYPTTLCGVAAVNDLASLSPFQATVYGSTRTYMPIGAIVDSSTCAVFMRFD